MHTAVDSTEVITMRYKIYKRIGYKPIVVYQRYPHRAPYSEWIIATYVPNKVEPALFGFSCQYRLHEPHPDADLISIQDSLENAVEILKVFQNEIPLRGQKLRELPELPVKFYNKK